MRDALYLLALALPALGACSSEPPESDTDTAQFRQVAEDFQQLYVGGGKNCGRIYAFIAEDVALVENGEAWDYAQLKEFCPHLPEKSVLDAWSDRIVLHPGLAYEFATMVYQNVADARRRETTARVWRKTNGEWKIIRMSSVLSVVPAEIPGSEAG
jgi:hypothetical protein